MDSAAGADGIRSSGIQKQLGWENKCSYYSGWWFAIGRTSRKKFYPLATGKFEHSPFSTDIERDARAAFLELLSKNGARPETKQTTLVQPYLPHAIGEAARLMGDPDARIIHGNGNSLVSRILLAFAGELHDACRRSRSAGIGGQNEKHYHCSSVHLNRSSTHLVEEGGRRCRACRARILQDLQKFELGIATFRAAWLAGMVR